LIIAIWALWCNSCLSKPSDKIFAISSFTLTNFFLHLIIFEEDYFIPLLKMTSRLFFLEYFWNIFSGIYFINSGFINPEIYVFHNDFLSSGFSIMEISFAYESSILETFLFMEPLFWNHPKLYKDIFRISKNVGVQEETPYFFMFYNTIFFQ